MAERDPIPPGLNTHTWTWWTDDLGMVSRGGSTLHPCHLPNRGIAAGFAELVGVATHLRYFLGESTRARVTVT